VRERERESSRALIEHFRISEVQKFRSSEVEKFRKPKEGAGAAGKTKKYKWCRRRRKRRRRRNDQFSCEGKEGAAVDSIEREPEDRGQVIRPGSP